MAMTRIEKSILIPLPVEKVFSYAADYRIWEQWFEGVSSFRPSTSIEHGNGARYAYKASMMGFTVHVETEIYEYVENKGWKGKATKGMPHTTYWIFESVEDNTRFTYALEYELPIPLIGRWLDKAFMKPQWEKIIETSLENLKRQLK